MSSRAHQDMGRFMPLRLRGEAVVSSCYGCPDYDCPVCRPTGEDIPYPVSGPVGDLCPLPHYHEPEEDGDERP